MWQKKTPRAIAEFLFSQTHFSDALEIQNINLVVPSGRRDRAAVLFSIGAARAALRRPLRHADIADDSHGVDFVPARNVDRIEINLDALGHLGGGDRHF